ncbi:hypothetical protein BH24ACT3_BH24ACT3_11790 [soil metagenome]
MPTYRRADVTAVTAERRGLQRVETTGGRAYVLTGLTGPVVAGDPVLLHPTTAELGLGPGGWHVVHWNLARDDWVEPGPGHIMKLRYTSLQTDTGAAEELHPEPPADLGGIPVVACGLHSQMACVVAAAKAAGPALRVAYVMTDGAALPLALSDLVAALTRAELLAGTVTCGHAFGGDLEAVGVPAALALARHVLGADVIVVAMGPGVVGTATTLGTTGLEVASVLDLTAALGGDPIACLRASSGDRRDRHAGVSHHSATSLDLVRSTVTVATDDADLFVHDRHHVVVVEPPDPDMAGLLARWELTVTTMGRTPDQDPAFFRAAGAAGTLAARRSGTLVARRAGHPS